jgi:hypothetical protein
LKTGPKCLPMFCAVKQRPSSPWYAHDSGSQPTGRDKVAVLVEKPIAMVVLSYSQPADSDLTARDAYSSRLLDRMRTS